MKSNKPVYVMCEPGVESRDFSAIIKGLAESITHSRATLKIVNLGIWRNNGWKRGNILQHYMSVDWYLERARNTSHRNSQLNANTIIYDLFQEPWQQQRPHYDVVVLKTDIYSGEMNNNFVIGLALKELGTVISVNRFLHLNYYNRFECIKTETLHEIGHVFGLPGDTRTKQISLSLGRHCTNECVMRQGLMVPRDWIYFTEQRINSTSDSPYCELCLAELRNFFS